MDPESPTAGDLPAYSSAVADLLVVGTAFAALFFALRLLRARSFGPQRGLLDAVAIILGLAIVSELTGFYTLATDRVPVSVLFRVTAACFVFTGALLLWLLYRQPQYVQQPKKRKKRKKRGQEKAGSGDKKAKQQRAELKRMKREIRQLRDSGQASAGSPRDGQTEVLVKAFEVISGMAQAAAASPVQTPAVMAPLESPTVAAFPAPPEPSEAAAVADPADRERHRFFREVVEAAPAAILIVDVDGRIELANREASTLFGYSRNELQGASLYDVVPNREDVLRSKVQENLNGSAEALVLGENGDLLIQRKDGQAIPVRLGMQKMIDHKSGAGVCSLIDLSPLVAERQHLKEANQKLQSSNSDLEQFAYVASHDLKEPVRKIAAFGDLLRTSAEAKLDEMEVNYLARIVGAADRMSHMVDDLLNFSRVNTENEARGNVDLGTVVDTVLGEHELEIRERGITVLRGDLPVVKAVRSQLFQLVGNLISNAIKFSAHRESPEISIGTRPDERSGMVCMYVRDNGMGIEAMHHERIFGVFERVNTDTPVEGNGIGLAICKKIMERNRGSIEVVSELDQGSEFRCYFEPSDG